MGSSSFWIKEFEVAETSSSEGPSLMVTIVSSFGVGSCQMHLTCSMCCRESLQVFAEEK